MWWLLVYDWEKVVSVCCLLESVEISWALTPEHTGLSVRLQKLADQLCVGLGLRQCVWIGIIVVYGMGSLVVVVVAGNTRHNNELQECGRRCRTMAGAHSCGCDRHRPCSSREPVLVPREVLQRPTSRGGHHPGALQLLSL